VGFWDWLPWNDDKPKAAPKPAAPKPTPEIRQAPPQQSKPRYTTEDLLPKNWYGTETRKPGTGYQKSAEELLLPKSAQTPQQVQQVKPFNMSPHLSSALSRSGWVVPTTAAPDPGLAMLETELDSANARELARFSYGLDEGEAARITDAYGSQNGNKTLDAKNVRVQSRATQAVPLTQDAYDKLTPEQRKAVDFNTLLVDAREKDLMLGPKGNSPVPDELKSYNQRAEKVFGKGGGSEAYAPNTLKLLEEIDFKAVGQDLDEFLSLERTVTADQLKGWTGQGGAAQRKSADGYTDAGEFGTIRSAENQAKVTADAIAKAGALIEKTLSQGDIGVDVNDFLNHRAGGPSKIGWADPSSAAFPDQAQADQNKTYWKILNMLADPSVESADTFWGVMRDLEYDEKQIDDVFKYIDQRTRDMAVSGKNPYATPDGAARSPQEIRALVGLGGL
jgi:hypothetical protein